MPYACRYQLLVEVLAAIDHHELPTLLPCAEPAVFSTAIVRKRDGQDIEIYTQTCAGHDHGFHDAAGYHRSPRLRTT